MFVRFVSLKKSITGFRVSLFINLNVVRAVIQVNNTRLQIFVSGLMYVWVGLEFQGTIKEFESICKFVKKDCQELSAQHAQIIR